MKSSNLATPLIDFNDEEPALLLIDIESADPPGEIEDIILTDDLLCIGSDENPRRSLFWTTLNVENRCVWALADTGSCRNLISEKCWLNLPIHPPIQPPGHTKVIAGNSKVLEVLGWVALRLEISTRTIYHECGIVRNLPVEFIVGGEFMKPHACTFQYVPNGRNEFVIQKNE